MQAPRRLFGTNGVRGVVGQDVTADLALRLGQAVGTWLKPGDRIAVATDARGSGPMLRQAFCSGVQAAGVHVVDLGILPTPGIQLWVRDHGLAGGAVITASHNPPEYNGIKLVAADGTETSRAQEEEVEAILAAGRFRQAAWDAVGRLEPEDGAVEHYLEAILSQVDVAAIRRRRPKVVVDPGGGAGCVTAPILLERLGVDVVRLSCELDGAFKDRRSEPSPANAKRCMEAVVRETADLGVLQDGDADRAVFVDESGAYVWGDTALALATLHEMRRAGPGLGEKVCCTTVSSSQAVADAARAAGGTVAITAVGSPIVAREMMRRNARIGGEDNGGILFARHQLCRDGLMATAFMVELLATTGNAFSQLCSEVPRYALWKEAVHVEDAAKAALLERLRREVPHLPGVREVDTQDGVKAYLDGGWVLARPSGTEPLFRVQGEARSEADARRHVEMVKRLLEAPATAR